MMKYTIMKRITQLLASILFIITVLTIYLVFDFAINNALSNKYSTNKHDHHHGHEHEHFKFKPTSSAVLLSKMNKMNPTLTYNPMINQERRTRSVKQKQNRVKPAQFHKSKTGIKINQIKRSVKEQRKLLLTPKNIQRKDIEPKIDKYWQ
jgi:hypothetical protein